MKGFKGIWYNEKDRKYIVGSPESLGNVGRAVLFVFSAGENTIAYLKKHGIAWTDNKKWLENP